MRGISQGVEVRDGRVEESERSEGDDVGLRVLVGKRQAVVSTNDVSGDGVTRLAERAVAMARVAPDDEYVGLADPSLLARDIPRSRSARSACADDGRTRAPRLRGGGRRACGQGRHQIGRRVGIDRNWRHGARDQHRLSRRVLALEPGHLGDGDFRRRDLDGARLRFHVGAACRRSRHARERRPHRRRAHGRARQSAQGRDLQGAGRVRPARVRLAGRSSGRVRSTAHRSRARQAF